MPIPAPKHLTGAIVAYLEAAQPFAPAIKGGVHFKDAARDNPFPYVVIEQAGFSSIPVMGGKRLDTPVFRFSLYFTAGIDGESLGNQLRDLVLGAAGQPLPAPLVFADGVDVNRQPASETWVEPDEERGPFGVDVWAYRFEVNWTVARG